MVERIVKKMDIFRLKISVSVHVWQGRMLGVITRMNKSRKIMFTTGWYKRKVEMDWVEVNNQSMKSLTLIFNRDDISTGFLLFTFTGSKQEDER